LLLLGEAIIGLFLYAVFTFVPLAVQMTIAVAAWLIIANNIFFPKKKKASLRSSMGSLPFPPFLAMWRGELLMGISG
jgi:hypothetical protein